MTEQIQQSVMGGWVLGSDSFVQELGLKTSRRLEKRKAGRPRKNPPMLQA